MSKINGVLITAVLCMSLHAMDGEPGVAAAQQLAEIMAQDNGALNWIWQRATVHNLLKTCDKGSKGRLLYHAMTKDDEPAYYTWVLNIVEHLCDNPAELLAQLKGFFADFPSRRFQLSDKTCHALLTQLGRSNFDDTTALSCLEYLVQQQAYLKCIDELGRTPLMYYVEFGRIALVKYLIACKTNVNVQDSRGNTPLHGAIKYGKHDVVELLLKWGAKPDIKNNAGQTPFDLDEASTLSTRSNDGRTIDNDAWHQE